MNVGAVHEPPGSSDVLVCGFNLQIFHKNCGFDPKTPEGGCILEVFIFLPFKREMSLSDRGISEGSSDIPVCEKSKVEKSRVGSQKNSRHSGKFEEFIRNPGCPEV
jgi:hypothetical protein